MDTESLFSLENVALWRTTIDRLVVFLITLPLPPLFLSFFLFSDSFGPNSYHQISENYHDNTTPDWKRYATSAESIIDNFAFS